MKLVRVFAEDNENKTLIAEFYLSEIGSAFCQVAEYDKDMHMISQHLIIVTGDNDKQSITMEWLE